MENFKETDTEVTFSVSAGGDVQFTLELEPESEYEVFIGGHFGRQNDYKSQRQAQRQCRAERRSERGRQSFQVLITVRQTQRCYAWYS